MASREPRCGMASVSRHIVWTCAAIGLGIIAGCILAPEPGGPANAPKRLDVATVVRVVFDLEGGDREVLFVDVVGNAGEELDRAVEQLARQLPVKVLRGDEADLSDPNQPSLTPTDPATGIPGLIVRVNRIEQSDPSEATATVSVIHSGLSGRDLELTFELTAEGWRNTGLTVLGQA